MKSLCLIGKDESEGLKNLVGDIGKYFDEIVLVSTAKDKKLKYTAKKLGVKVFEEDHGSGADFDFAAARNSSFDQATGEILAWFDLDDRVINGEVIPEIYEAMEKCDWVYCNYNYAFDKFGNVIIKHLKPRFMKKGTGKWEKSVHEVYDPIKNVIQCKDSDFLVEPLIVNHQHVYGGAEDLKRIQEKAKRNLAILIKEYDQGGDIDQRTVQYIGTTLMSLEKYPEAIPFLMEHYKKSGSTEDKFWSLKRAAFCHRMLKDYDSAINLLLEGLKLYPNWQTMYFDLADIYSQLGDHNKVIEWTIAGASKKMPDTTQMIEPLDYELNPMGRLADAYLMTGDYDKGLNIAKKLAKKYPGNPIVEELLNTAKESVFTEDFVTSFLRIADEIRKNDRLKAVKLFECLPNRLDEDIRIQTERQLITPPKTWSDKSIVIYCGRSLEEWAYPSLFTGIGGSEYMVIKMGEELTKLGFEVTVYNKCGDFRGTYNGVEYLPFYHFNPQDNFNTVIAWRNPSFFANKIKAKKKIVWLHDIANETQFSDKAVENTDKFIFLSKWHRNNMPSIPDEKIFISNNGIDPEMFKETKEKRPNSLLWTSSYDRGLLPFIKNIWPLIKKEIPEVTLDVAYGWQNIDKELDLIPSLRDLREELAPLLEGEGITHHNRLNESGIAELYKTSQVLVYASEFGETNNISSQKAQASGCYVITTPQAGATPEYLKFGELVGGEGIYTDKKQQELYAQKVIEYLRSPKNAPEDIVEAFSLGKTAEGWKESLLCNK